MSEEQRRGVWPVAVAGVALASVLYVLSIGPVWAIVAPYATAEHWYFVLYAPLHWVCDRSDSVKAAVNAYAYWCVELVRR